MTGRLKILLIVLCGLGVLAGASLWMRPHELVRWNNDFQAASAESRRTGKPLFLDFTALWCGPCQDMRRRTWSNAKVANALERDYIPVQIDIDAHPDLAQRFGAEAIPHLAVVDPQGNVTMWIEGELAPEPFLHWLASQSSGGPGVRFPPLPK